MARGGPSTPLIAFVGPSGSGKTRLIEGVIKELGRRGLRVVALKHVPREGFSIDEPGKDTWRMAMAGAAAVACVSPEELAAIFKGRGTSAIEALRALESFEAGFDLALAEGFRGELCGDPSVPKVVVARSAKEAEEYARGCKWVLAVVGDFEGGSFDAPKLGFSEVEKLTDLIASSAAKAAILRKLAGLNCGKCGYRSCAEHADAIARGESSIDACKASADEVELWVGGKRVPLNKFVQAMLKGAILGMASALKGVEASGRGRILIEIR